jgi:hypothetical protein
MTVSARKPIATRKHCRLCAIGFIGLMWLGAAWMPALAADTGKATPVKLAVFAFELEDVSPAASYAAAAGAGDAVIMEQVSSEARRVLALSGRYSLIDVSKVDAKPVLQKQLRNCGGCEAAIARQLGAQQSLIGVVTRATQTDYYVLIQIRDTRTGKILDQQSANFAGGDDGWASGTRMLIKHQILASQD